MDARGLNRWWTVAAGAGANAFGAGPIMVYAYSIAAEGMLAEFGWTRSVSALFFSAFLIGNGIGCAVLGWLISRFGVSRPSAALAAMFGAAFALVAILPPDIPLFCATFFVVGFGGAACTPMPYAVSIRGLFDARRGLALAIVVAGSAITGPLMPQMARLFTNALGWRSNFEILGILAAAAPLAALIFVVRTPPGTVVEGGEAEVSSRSTREIYFANRSFWIISCAILATSIATFGGMTSLVGLFHGKGYGGATIANIVSVAAIISLVAKMCVGSLLDRFHAPFLSAIVFAIATFGFVLLLTTSAPLWAFVGAGSVGLALGVEGNLLTYLISRYFPLVEFSRVVGVVWVFWAWGGGLGTLITAGSLRAGLGYLAAFVTFTILQAAASGLIVFLGPYRNR